MSHQSRLPPTLPLLLLLLLCLPLCSPATPPWLHWPTVFQPPVPSTLPTTRATPPTATASHATALPPWVVGAGDSNLTAQYPLPYPRIMMHRPEADLISSYLRPNDTYLEFGIGGSTLAFARLVGMAFGVEHDCEWVDYVRREVWGEGGYGNLRVRCVRVGRGERRWGRVSAVEHASYGQFREYVEAMRRGAVGGVDKVVIDGRARLGCAVRVLGMLREGAVVFVHDFYARVGLYGKVLRYYEEVGRVLAVRNVEAEMGPVDEPQGLVVLRRREGVGEVAVDEVERLYAETDWREGFLVRGDGVGGWVRWAWGMREMRRWGRARNVEMLVAMVKRDVMRMVVVYAAFSFIARNCRGKWPLLYLHYDAGKSCLIQSSRPAV